MAAHTTHYAHGLRGDTCERQVAGRAGTLASLVSAAASSPMGRSAAPTVSADTVTSVAATSAEPAHEEPAPSWVTPGHDLSPHTQHGGEYSHTRVHTARLLTENIKLREVRSLPQHHTAPDQQGWLHRTAAGAGPALHGGTAGPCGQALWSRSRPGLAAISGPRPQAAEPQAQLRAATLLPCAPVPPRPLTSSGAHAHPPPAPNLPPHTDQTDLPGSAGLSHPRGPDAGRF